MAGLAWLEFEKPDLDAAERFLTDFGFTVADRMPDLLVLRGLQASVPCLAVRRGPQAAFVGPAFQAAARDDLDRLARSAAGRSPRTGAATPSRSATQRDPGAGRARRPGPAGANRAVPAPAEVRATAGAGQRHAAAGRQPAEIERLGHVVLGTSRFRAALDWYLDTLGLIVSDFLYLDGQRERGPVMAFIRCDQGSVPADHHTLAMLLGPHTGYVHSAYQLTDLDEVAAAGEYLREHGYRHAWGIGGHIQGSQIFDYGATPADVRALRRRGPVRCLGAARLGPAVGQRAGPVGTAGDREFTGARDPGTGLAAIKALREKGNEIDFAALRGLVKAMNS